MVRSRLARVEERRERQRLVFSLIGMIAVLGFLAIFGLKILVGFSLLVDRIRGGSPPSPAQNVSVLVSPILDPLPEATNINELTITGSAQSGVTVVVYVDGSEKKKLTVLESGTFSVPVTLPEGSHTISAKVIDDKGNASELSNIFTVVVKKTPPTLEMSQPNDGDKITGEKNTVLVTGHTEERAHVSVNGRVVIINSDGSFRMTVSLSDGENIIKIIATDEAGNQTLLERKVTYEK